jgi:catalase (peroxidase I)
MQFILGFITPLTLSNPSNNDFLELKQSLKNYILTDQTEKIAKIVRMSFHDLINYNPVTHTGGPHGCIAMKPIIDFRENNGLSEQVFDLQSHVINNFPNVNFTFGDVISLAGKVAVETAYPCMQIKWRYGRTKCSNLNEVESGPSSKINTLEQYQPFLNRYGLTAQEMAILTAGSHGLSAAAADVKNSGFGTFDFSDVYSGKQWIINTLKFNWVRNTSSVGNIQYETYLENHTTFMRLPSDLVFFPTVTNYSSQSANHIQDKLASYTHQDRSAFDQDFATVYSKMLEIGVNNYNLVDFIEPSNNGICSDTTPNDTTSDDTTSDDTTPSDTTPDDTTPSDTTSDDTTSDDTTSDDTTSDDTTPNYNSINILSSTIKNTFNLVLIMLFL